MEHGNGLNKEKFDIIEVEKEEKYTSIEGLKLIYNMKISNTLDTIL